MDELTGCTVAEKTFLQMRTVAAQHQDQADFVAISHSDQLATEHWLASLSTPEENSAVRVVVDEQRIIYASWGLGVSSLWHVLNPSSLWSVYTLGKQEGIWNRPTESGTRWQTAGTFVVDGEGNVKLSKPSVSADEVPDFEEALRSLEV
jgi:hypothetical protein